MNQSNQSSNQLNQSHKPQERQQEVLTILKRDMHRYEEQGRLTNDHYLSVKEKKYNYIVSGGQFKVVDSTEELKNMIAYVGGQIPTINYKSGGEMINKPEITWEGAKRELENLIVKC